jgi:hypothetical protein
MSGYIALDSRKNMYISGYLKGPGDIDPGPGVVTIPQGSWVPGFVCRLDSNGTFMDVLASGSAGSWPTNIATDTLDNLYLTGLYSDSLDLDPGPGTFILGVQGGSDVFTSKLDKNFQLKWAGGLKGEADGYAHIAVDRYQNIFLCGLFKDSVDVDPGPQVHSISTGTALTGYMVKLSSGIVPPPPPPPPNTTGLSCATVQNTSIWPNPCAGTIYFDPPLQENSTVKLMDISGKTVGIRVQDNGSRAAVIAGPGAYVVEITSTEGKILKRIIVE